LVFNHNQFSINIFVALNPFPLVPKALFWINEQNPARFTLVSGHNVSRMEFTQWPDHPTGVTKSS
jgi:hypothetical protein